LKVLAHEDVAEELRNTGDMEIIENSPFDYYWGAGKSGKG
jgi:N-glycosidase YbiA